MQSAIYLDQAVPKCIARAHLCSRRADCALHMVNAAGRKLADFSSPFGCDKYRPVADHRAPKEQARPAHDYVKGLTVF